MGINAWLIKGFFDTIPKELDESAKVDGATHSQTFFKIILPVATPILVVVFLLSFMTTMNELLLAQNLLRGTDGSYTLAVGLSSYVNAGLRLPLGTVRRRFADRRRSRPAALLHLPAVHRLGSHGRGREGLTCPCCSGPEWTGWPSRTTTAPSATCRARSRRSATSSPWRCSSLRASSAVACGCAPHPTPSPCTPRPPHDRTTGEGVRWRAEVRVHNPVTPYRFALEGGPFGYRWLNGGGVHDHDVPDVEDFRIVTFAPPPSWLADRVAYQIFPDRFASSGAPRHWPSWAAVSAWDDPIDPSRSTQQLYGGDLAGIEARLDHIERLGVNLLYLTPFFPAESSHRYNASTFDHVDPLLGGDGALSSLLAGVAPSRVRVIGDITANHSGDTHGWFQTARADAGSAEAGFYFFRHHPDEYEAWFGVPSLPKFDLRNEALRRRLVDGPDSVWVAFSPPTSDSTAGGWTWPTWRAARGRRRQPRRGVDDAPHHGRDRRRRLSRRRALP